MIDSLPHAGPSSRRQPILNAPAVVIGLIGMLVVIHGVRELALSRDADSWLVLLLAFVPVRETYPLMVGTLLPGGDAARVWSFVTYALLHANWGHLIINAVWLAAFGSPLAWRFGPTRFILFSAIGAAAGAIVHLALDPRAVVPLVGASAAISAHMAAVSRFAFAAGGPLWRGRRVDDYRRPAAPLAEVLRDRQAIAFLGVWFAVNLVFGLGTIGSGVTSGAVAWDAHIGGFVAGLLLFPVFDPVQNHK